MVIKSRLPLRFLPKRVTCRVVLRYPYCHYSVVPLLLKMYMHIIRIDYFFYCRLVVPFHRSSLLCHCRHRLWDFAACATARARAAAPAAAILYCSAPLISVGRAFGGSSGGQGSMGTRLKASAAFQCALAAV